MQNCNPATGKEKMRRFAFADIKMTEKKMHLSGGVVVRNAYSTKTSGKVVDVKRSDVS